MQFIQKITEDPALFKTFQQNYRFVRFEDMALHMDVMARKIYEFLNITMPAKVQKFILADPNVDKWVQPRVGRQHISSAKRKQKSTDILNKWRKLLDTHTLKYIQAHCSGVMKTLGYPLVPNYKTQKNFKILILDSLPDEVSFTIAP